jgi:hypothetical protein
VLKIEIAERDRAFLREGLPVKLKFNAFPYQRYGLIDGTLEYISPADQAVGPNKQPVYEGRVRLAQDYYEVARPHYPLHYGMTATAEIVVRERRLIDLGSIRSARWQASEDTADRSDRDRPKRNWQRWNQPHQDRNMTTTSPWTPGEKELDHERDRAYRRRSDRRRGIHQGAQADRPVRRPDRAAGARQADRARRRKAGHDA